MKIGIRRYFHRHKRRNTTSTRWNKKKNTVNVILSNEKLCNRNQSAMEWTSMKLAYYVYSWSCIRQMMNRVCNSFFHSYHLFYACQEVTFTWIVISKPSSNNYVIFFHNKYWKYSFFEFPFCFFNFIQSMWLTLSVLWFWCCFFLETSISN